MPQITGVSVVAPYTIEDIQMSLSWALPGQTQKVNYKVKDDAGVVTDATTTSIVVRDPAGSTRVVYDGDNLSTTGVGVYSYVFDVPDDVVEGDWYVNISATVSGETTVRNAHFDVRER